MFDGALFAANLRAAREARGLSQFALADLTGVDQSQISLYELDRCGPSARTLCLLADGLGMTETELLHEEEKGIGKKNM